MNFAKFLKTPFLQNTSGLLLLKQLLSLPPGIFFFGGVGEGGNETLLHFFRCNNVVNLFDNTVLFENVEKKILIDVMTHNRHRRN